MLYLVYSVSHSKCSKTFGRHYTSHRYRKSKVTKFGENPSIHSIESLLLIRPITAEQQFRGEKGSISKVSCEA